MNLGDPQWERIDPTPNVHNLFVEFNQIFFYNKLGSVSVVWSKRMTLCAGLCSYRTRTKECTIKLSEPLLKLRSRKDLLETLLHEMIHAYLFVTKTFDNRSDHGPEFLSHMNRINSQAKLNITVYHSFNDEVAFYQQHWWRCNGVCQYKAPYYGIVKRAMNRKPAPSDSWWDEHRLTCGGEFQKIREPRQNLKASATKENVKINKRTENVTKSQIKTNLEEVRSFWDKKYPNVQQVRSIWDKKYPEKKVQSLNLIQCETCDEFVDEAILKTHVQTCKTPVTVTTRVHSLVECDFCNQFVSAEMFGTHFETCQKMNSSDVVYDQVVDLIDSSDEFFDQDFDINDTVVL